MTLYEQYTTHLKKIADLNGAIALLHWDSEVNAPEKGAGFRSQQMATLTGMSHELSTSAAFGALLRELLMQLDQLDEKQAANIRLSWEDYELATKLPSSFVEELSRARSNAFQAWIKARKAKDFSLYRKPLKEIVRLKRKEAELLGYEGHPYNALLNQYEKGATVAMLDVLFKDVREQLVAFTQRLRQEGKPTDNAFLFKTYPKDQQWQYGLDLLKQMGYDFGAGRQDISEHPFTTNFSPLDVRVTTRINEQELMSMIGTCLHEGGHGLYEQGLPSEQYGRPLGYAASLGIHESQSRLWENNVGLSKAYWVANFPALKALYPSQLEGVDVELFYAAINQIQPNFVRVEADELHYHLHVLIRYEIEKGLMEGSMEVENLDKIWNEKYKAFLGLDVPDDKLGVLQDVHWSEGLLGYFPTYSLGSFYAAQFFHQANKEIPTLSEQLEAGDSSALLAWLREKIHQYGRQYTSEELCQRITGEGLNLKYFMDYAREKYSKIYQLS
jgi:carboxypeptidase Taq